MINYFKISQKFLIYTQMLNGTQLYSTEPILSQNYTQVFIVEAMAVKYSIVDIYSH